MPPGTHAEEPPLDDRWGAYVRRFDAPWAATGAGPLDGWTLAVKDCFHLIGTPITAGSADFAEWHAPPPADAWAVAALRAAGARVTGTVAMHELAYGITGINRWQGTPANPMVPGAIPGGSSSGSAVAVAAGLARLALGTDTGGSIRAPAAHCGIWGYRPTHGLLPLTGCIPLAPSFDTVGLMARTADDLARALEALWAAPGAGTLALGPAIDTVQLVLDAVERCQTATQRAIEATASRISASGVRVRELVLGAMDEIREAQAPIQGAEAWRTHRAWIESMSPKIGDDVANLLNIGAGRSADELARAAAERARLVADLDRRIGVASALLLPAALGPAPFLRDLADADRSLAHRRGTLTLHNVATLPGLPAVAFPIQRDDAQPLGAQLVGPRGRDRDVVALAALSAPRSP
jgi:Asp-tRNA(Asn)/Glu-tRNA(Gln) amidotransferase A subunit family amidase